MADPKLAKAPEPRPKAVDAPGEARPVEGVGMALKGFVLPPWDELSPPNRLAKGGFDAWFREEDGEEFESGGLLDGVERESLLEL